MTHLSRFSEELVLWTSAQFNFIELPDRFCTGSSIMPQKKNPDVPELVRGKTGRVHGHLVSLLTLMKSQPLAYNKDNQEDKEPLFDLIDTVKDCLFAYSEMMPAVSCNKEEMYAAAKQGYATATDLADYLVKKGMPFRDAHEVVGKSVAFGIETEEGSGGALASRTRGILQPHQRRCLRRIDARRIDLCARSYRRHCAKSGIVGSSSGEDGYLETLTVVGDFFLNFQPLFLDTHEFRLKCSLLLNQLVQFILVLVEVHALISKRGFDLV